MTYYEGDSEGQKPPFDVAEIVKENAAAVESRVDDAMRVAMGENLPEQPAPGVAAANLPPIAHDSALVQGKQGTAVTTQQSLETSKSRVAPTGAASSVAPSIRRSS